MKYWYKFPKIDTFSIYRALCFSSIFLTISFFIFACSKPEINKEKSDNKLLMIAPSISAKFIENVNSVKLFVITGEILNNGNNPRSNIQLTGIIYTKNKKMIKLRKVFCGNILTNSELRSLKLDIIQDRLNKPKKNEEQNNLRHDSKSPFMIVFAKPEESLERYTVKVTDSSPGVD